MDDKPIEIRSEIDVPYIESLVLGTGETHKVAIHNQELPLVAGRGYYVPVNIKDIDSDKFKYLKTFSSTADKFDVKFIKNGKAFIITLQSGIKLKTDTRLCAVWG